MKVSVNKETNVTIIPPFIKSNTNIEANVSVKGQDVQSSSLSKSEGNKTKPKAVAPPPVIPPRPKDANP